MSTIRETLPQSLVVSVVLFTTSACAQGIHDKLPEEARRILSSAEQWDLYSLQPFPRTEVADKTSFFYPHQVLGRLTVKRTDGIGEKIVHAFEATIGKGDRQSRCFEPKHSIHAEHGGDAIDIVISFHCGWAYIFVNEKEVAGIIADMSGDEMFDTILKDAGIPLATFDSNADK